MLAPALLASLLLVAKEPGPPEAPLPSTLSAEHLRDTSLVEAALGWPRLRLTYAQDVAPALDLGLFADLDHSTTELLTGGMVRTPLEPGGGFDRALRLSVAWYRDFGTRWLYKRNHPDAGLSLGLGFSFTRSTRSGDVSLLLDLPATVTMKKDGGLLLAPRAAVAYQASLYGPFTLGLELGAGLRFGFGNAPLKRGMGELTLLALAGYRVR